MAQYRGKAKTLSMTATAVVVVIFIVIYLLDSIFGLGSKQIDGECEFHFLNVGQGDCTMIITEDSVVVIDAGPDDHADSTQKYIKSYTDTIDYLILTHPHEDHIGGADEIIESMNVKNIIMSDASTDTGTFSSLLDVIEKSQINLIEAQAGDSYSTGEIYFTILAPIAEFTDLNDYSIVTKVEFGETSVIITGDVENHSEKLIAEEYASFLHADILQVGHHGSYTSNCEEFVSSVLPEYAVISCGKDNEYGHPHSETIERLEKYGIDYYRTDELGHIVFTSDGENVQYAGQ